MNVRNRRLIINYDENHDVLYVSVGRPKPSYCDEDIDGILIRKTFASNRFSGVTILDFSKRTKEQIRESLPYKINVDELYQA